MPPPASLAEVPPPSGRPSAHRVQAPPSPLRAWPPRFGRFPDSVTTGFRIVPKLAVNVSVNEAPVLPDDARASDKSSRSGMQVVHALTSTSENDRARSQSGCHGFLTYACNRLRK